jgi:hypothetical protein
MKSNSKIWKETGIQFLPRTRNLYSLILAFFISSFFIGAFAQSNEFDPQNLLPPKLLEIEQLADGQFLILNNAERTYIQTYLDAIRNEKKLVKRKLKKAKALERPDKENEMSTRLSNLIACTEKYYMVLYNSNPE